ncbi:MAG: alpha-L-fucosidase [Chloroflexota bacterium]
MSLAEQTSAALAQIDEVVAQGPFEDTWESLLNYEIPDWYQNEKFGIFIHWGPYCVPAFGNEWYPRRMYLKNEEDVCYTHHIETYGSQKNFGYKDFIPMFKAEKYDAKEWASIFKESGARFIVPVAEHHDGFPMYECSFTEWDSSKMGPERDVTGELADAVRAEGMIFGASSHRAEHFWFFDGGMTFDSDVQDPANDGLYGPAAEGPENKGSLTEKPPTKEFMDDWLVRTCELVDKYQPQLVWFDWWIQNEAFIPYLKKFGAYYYNKGAEWGKGVAINHKYNAFPEGAAVFDIERGQLSGIRPLLWQNDTSVSKNSWGYIDDHKYKDVSMLIHDLVDIVSKNGALLLNVGPKADGTIPDIEIEMLREIGRWLEVNGEAIYDTGYWTVFGEGPTKVAEGAFTDTKRAGFTGEDIRFTTKGDTLYATVMAWPGDGNVTIKSLGTDLYLYNKEVSSVSLVGSDAELSWMHNGSGLHVSMPEEKPCDHAYVLKIA